jgi:four helix bundle protein
MVQSTVAYCRLLFCLLLFVVQTHGGNMKKKPYTLSERTFQFADELLDWIEKCPRNFMTLELLRQLIRAGTSAGANMEEGEEEQSPKDEASKPCPAGLAGLGIALKEACESRYFLRLLKKRVGSQNNPDDLIPALIPQKVC